jgi:hypothetical protein
MLLSLLPRSSMAVCLLLTAGSLFDCTPLEPPPAPARPLPAYAGHAAELFDDVIEPGAVGVSLDPGDDPRTDRRVRERAQIGDATVRLRITTLTTKEEDSGTRYIVGVQVVEKLTGQYPPPPTFELSLGRTSPSVGIVKAMDNQLVGKTFIAFLRTFVRGDGDHELHFHLGADTKAEVEAVTDAAALLQL